jgi:hypothetical protein
MSVFNGRMFLEVLEKTLWYNKPHAKIQARNRMQKLEKKYKLFLKKNTGLQSPRSCYILSEHGKEIVRTLFNKNITNISISPVTTMHTIYEMLTYYYLKKIGKNPIRTIVYKHSKKFKHTPDLLYYFKQDSQKMVYVEIEKSFKNSGAYNTIFANSYQDNVHKLLYVVENDKMLNRFAKFLPRSEKLMLVTIDTLIENAQVGKIGAKTQSKILSEIEK